MLLIWFILLVVESVVSRKRSRRRSGATKNSSAFRLEPYLMNFTVRFLYEVFFELCICLMINLSYLSAQQPAAYWLISFSLGMLALIGLVWVML